VSPEHIKSANTAIVPQDEGSDIRSVKKKIRKKEVLSAEEKARLKRKRKNLHLEMKRDLHFIAEGNRSARRILEEEGKGWRAIVRKGGSVYPW